MRGASRASAAELRERLATVLAPGHGTGAAAAAGRTGPGAAALGDELFAVVALLDREHSLRRALSDPAKAAAEKSSVVRALLEGRVSPATLDLVAAAAELRWSRPRDLTDTLEQLAVLALVAAAEAEGRLDDLEDELFRFGRVVAGEPRLRAALSSVSAPPEGKRELVTRLVGGKVTDAALRLITAAALQPRGRSLDRNLEEFARLAAEQRQRLVAVVRTATPLTGAQRSRLAAALAATYGRQVHLDVVLEPDVVGGLSVQVGDEVIDGTVAGRLESVRRRLAG